MLLPKFLLLSYSYAGDCLAIHYDYRCFQVTHSSVSYTSEWLPLLGKVYTSDSCTASGEAELAMQGMEVLRILYATWNYLCWFTIFTHILWFLRYLSHCLTFIPLSLRCLYQVLTIWIFVILLKLVIVYRIFASFSYIHTSFSEICVSSVDNIFMNYM